MQKNSEIILEITDITSDGNGVGRYEGIAVFVPQSAVGDVLKVHIVKVKKNYCFGKIVEIIKPSDKRSNNDCDIFNKCGGCVYRHINYTAEAELKQRTVEETMKRIGSVFAPCEKIIKGDFMRYRNKAQFPVTSEGSVGFFAVHSHRVIACEDCLLQPMEFRSISKIFEQFIKNFSISVYSEETGKGLVRHLYLRKGEKTGELMVCIVINGEKLPHSDALINALKNEVGNNLKTVVLNVNTKKTNVILGEKNITLYGEGYITDILCENKIRINPLSFYQVNRNMAEVLYQKAQEYAEADGKKVLDLYCGAGTIGLSFAKKAESIIGVEIVEQAVKDAQFNAKINDINNARFICADAKEAAVRLKDENIKTDVVILDPPRKGCEDKLLDIVANDFAPERIVYVSCDPATLARDCKILATFGYRVLKYTPVDMFPRTAHVETVALLCKNAN
ncbi:MAG: 23S rRNA (uracil(1939)-C(5))-methyltransferase RlmD [Ruminococcaceae bacterium]|nr:23S rRNA (uracil(1939)-C(5))-methyltransferase RlmD [Oscillospiraceae bacterium]